MPKFTAEEFRALSTLRALCDEEWSAFAQNFAYNSAMNVVGLTLLKRAIKANLFVHFKGTDTIACCTTLL